VGFRSPIWIRGILKSVAFSALCARKLAELAKPNVLSEVVCGQRLTTNFVASSGLAKSSRLNFLIPGSLVRVQPGVLDFTGSRRRPGQGCCVNRCVASRRTRRRTTPGHRASSPSNSPPFSTAVNSSNGCPRAGGRVKARTTPSTPTTPLPRPVTTTCRFEAAFACLPFAETRMPARARSPT
jgi:hypothetical protein